jgi:hypothetical protein
MERTNEQAATARRVRKPKSARQTTARRRAIVGRRRQHARLKHFTYLFGRDGPGRPGRCQVAADDDAAQLARQRQESAACALAIGKQQAGRPPRQADATCLPRAEPGRQRYNPVEWKRGPAICLRAPRRAPPPIWPGALKRLVDTRTHTRTQPAASQSVSQPVAHHSQTRTRNGIKRASEMRIMKARADRCAPPASERARGLERARSKSDGPG